MSVKINRVIFHTRKTSIVGLDYTIVIYFIGKVKWITLQKVDYVIIRGHFRFDLVITALWIFLTVGFSLSIETMV